MNQAKLGKCLYWVGGLGVLSKAIADLCLDIDRVPLRWIGGISAIIGLTGWWILRRAKPTP